MNSRSATAHLGRFGVWSGEVRFSPPDASTALAQELEALGWTTTWIPGGVDDRVLDDVDRLLSATQTMTVCTGILNIWKFEPDRIGAWWARQAPERRARVMLGLGVSHAPNIGDAYKQPVATMRSYVTKLLDAGVPGASLCLAALGPKMLELAGELTAGAHPYLVTPEHTAIARRHMGPDALLAPEQAVILETDPQKAREAGRKALENYLRLPNYLNSWRRLGFTEEDVSTPSDRLIDGLFAWGDVDAVRERIQAHLDAGADHVCIQAVSGSMLSDIERSRAIWREMASDLLG